MGDITLNVRGDGTDGAGAMREVAGATRELDGAQKKLGETTKAVGESAKRSIGDWLALKDQVMATLSSVIDFSKESIAAFAQQEKADKQLEMVAGNLADAFKAQASAMQSTLGVSDDMVQRMQTLALRYNMLETDVEPATRALLDWAAATGGDAESGMTSLTRAIEFGQDKIKSLGIEFEGTTDKTRNMELAIEALAKKFGGSADKMADTLSGRTSRLAEAFGELQEKIGGAFDTIDRRVGILDLLTGALKDLGEQASMVGNAFNFEWMEFFAKGTQNGEAVGADAPFRAIVKGTRTEREIYGDEEGAGLADPVDGVRASARVTKKVFTPNKEDKEKSAAAKKYADEREAERVRNIALIAAEEERDMDRRHKALNDERELNEQAISDAHEHGVKEVKVMEENSKAWEEKNAEIAVRREFKQREQWEREDKAEEARTDEKIKKAEESIGKLEKASERAGKRMEKTMAEAGAAVGMAFAVALADAIATAQEGGEVDAIGLALDLAFTTSAIVGGAIIDYYAPGAGRAAAGITNVVGTIAARERKKAFNKEMAFKHPNDPRYAQKHDGGWVGQYHSGGWPGVGTDEEMFIAQHGERVLSRQDVGRMGGPQAVDSMARGGGSRAVNFTFVSMDSKGTREFMEGNGGRGILNATRTGRGPLAGMLVDA